MSRRPLSRRHLVLAGVVLVGVGLFLPWARDARHSVAGVESISFLTVAVTGTVIAVIASRRPHRLARWAMFLGGLSVLVTTTYVMIRPLAVAPEVYWSRPGWGLGLLVTFVGGLVLVSAATPGDIPSEVVPATIGSVLCVFGAWFEWLTTGFFAVRGFSTVGLGTLLGAIVIVAFVAVAVDNTRHWSSEEAIAVLGVGIVIGTTAMVVRLFPETIVEIRDPWIGVGLDLTLLGGVLIAVAGGRAYDRVRGRRPDADPGVSSPG